MLDEPRLHRRPVISRETRLLLATAFIALAALWLLARFRFPDRPPSANPVVPVLEQLGRSGRLDTLAEEVVTAQPRILPWLALPSPGPADVVPGPRRRPVLIVQEAVAVGLIAAGDRAVHQDLLAWDPVLQLGALRVDPPGPGAPPALWPPTRLRQPRLFVVPDAAGATLALRPVLVSALVPLDVPDVPVPLWAVPEGTPIGAGEFLFTPEGELAGLVIDRGGVPVLIPGEAVVGAADRLLTQPADTTGGLGIEVQPLSSTLRQATGATAGVVVTRVDPHGPSAGLLATGDVIESIDGTTVGTREQWDAWLSRAEPGRRATLDVRSQGTVRSIGIETASVPDRRSTLGLTLVAESGLGSAVQWVERFTAGERAGLRRGDLITAAGDVQAPPPGEIRRLYAALSGGESLLLGVTRGTTHLVVALAP